jgi:hypothetical protein
MRCRAAPQTLCRVTLTLMQQAGAIAARCAAALALAPLVSIPTVAPTLAVLLTEVVGLSTRAAGAAAFLWIAVAWNVL